MWFIGEIVPVFVGLAVACARVQVVADGVAVDGCVFLVDPVGSCADGR